MYRYIDRYINNGIDNVSIVNKKKMHFNVVAIGVYFFLTPLSIVPINIGGSLLRYISYLLCAAIIFNILVERKKIDINRQFVLMSVYMFYSMASIFWSIIPGLSWTTIVSLLQVYIVFFLITSSPYEKYEMDFMIKMSFLSGVVCSLIIIFFGTKFENWSDRNTIVLFGGVADPNMLCGYFLLPIVKAIDYIEGKYMKIVKLFSILSLVVMLDAIVYTGSRGGLIAVIVMLISLFMLKNNRSLLKKILILLGFITVFFIAFNLLWNMIPANVQERFTIEAVLHDRGSGRFDIWNILIYYFNQGSALRHFIGFGVSSTSPVLRNFGSVIDVAHNHFLQICFDQGFIGLLLFCILAFFILKNSYKNNKLVFFAIIGMIALSMSLTTYGQYKMFWNLLIFGSILETKQLGGET